MDFRMDNTKSMLKKSLEKKTWTFKFYAIEETESLRGDIELSTMVNKLVTLLSNRTADINSINVQQKKQTANINSLQRIDSTSNWMGINSEWGKTAS